MRGHPRKSPFNYRVVCGEAVNQSQVKGHKDIDSKDASGQVCSERCQRKQLGVFSAKTKALL